MKCPDCGAEMDPRLTGTWNEHWECPFDSQIVWAQTHTDNPT